MNSRIRTLWTIQGRFVDGRELFDKNNTALRRGRIDIPKSQTVIVEGYSKVEFHVLKSDGTVAAYPTFAEVIKGVNGKIESIVGGDWMTVFFDLDKDAAGIYQIDIYKEWDDSTPDPEPEPSPDMDVAGITKFFTTYVDNPDYLFVWNEMTTVGGEERNRRLPHEMFGVALINSLKHMRPQTLKALQDVLGIVPPAAPEA